MHGTRTFASRPRKLRDAKKVMEHRSFPVIYGAGDLIDSAKRNVVRRGIQ